MTLDEYVLAFRTLSRCHELTPDLRAKARHFYICLALDLPNATQARQKLLEEVQHHELHECGPNVPPAFEARLQDALTTIVLEEGEPPESLLLRLAVLIKQTLCDFVKLLNPGFRVCDPFCRCDCNGVNRSFGWNGNAFYRYISLAVFEKHVLFPGKSGGLPVSVENRRFFYSQARVNQLTRSPALFGLERDNRILLGRPPEEFGGGAIQSVIFLVPSDSAPHKVSADATYIASRLGLPDYLLWDTADKRRNQGFAVLKLQPDAHDLLYRPTIVDALDHFAFRPGPTDNGEGELFRHGWTRVFKSGELYGDDAVIADELGCPEVIMPSRSERFPSESLELDSVCFFES